MDADAAREIAVSWARAEFGRFLEVRDVSVVRKVVGRVYCGELYCALKEGDVRVGAVCIDESGAVVEQPDADTIANALVAVRRAATARPLAEPARRGEETDFSDLAVGSLPAAFPAPSAADASGDDLESVFGALESVPLRDTINRLVATGERDNLLEARKLLPQLLVAPDGRGGVLQQMGELELLLGRIDLGVNYLEAAAREFADIADVAALEAVAERTIQAIGAAAFEPTATKRLLDRTRARLKPISRLGEAPLFAALAEEELFHLEGASVPLFITGGQDLMREGEPATTAYVVKSGVLSVRLETPGGGTRVVRSCLPGEFVGETCVLGPRDSACTATVRGEAASSLWMFDGEQLRALIAEYPAIGACIESARTMHQLDSFLSMHQAAASLNAAARDQLLGSIDGISRVRAGEILCPKGEPPTAVFLVIEGRLEYRAPSGAAVRSCGPDEFAGLRDALHELPLEGEIAAAIDGVVVRFDPDRLRAIAATATPEVIAVLEKLE